MAASANRSTPLLRKVKSRERDAAPIITNATTNSPAAKLQGWRKPDPPAKSCPRYMKESCKNNHVQRNRRMNPVSKGQQSRSATLTFSLAVLIGGRKAFAVDDPIGTPIRFPKPQDGHPALQAIHLESITTGASTCHEGCSPLRRGSRTQTGIMPGRSPLRQHSQMSGSCRQGYARENAWNSSLHTYRPRSCPPHRGPE